MKRILLSVALLISVITSSAPAHIPVIGIFESSGVIDFTYTMPYASFNTYVWARPGEDGLICADFKMVTPEWVLNVNTVFNSNVILQIDQRNPYGEDGASICLSSCATDLIWLCRVTHLPTVVGVIGDIWLIPRPSIGQIQVASCLEGNPIGPAEAPCPFGLNYPSSCWLANETSTWGAIKSIFTE